MSSSMSSSLVLVSTNGTLLYCLLSSSTSGLHFCSFLRHWVQIFCPTTIFRFGNRLTSSSVIGLKPDLFSTVWTLKGLQQDVFSKIYFFLFFDIFLSYSRECITWTNQMYMYTLLFFESNSTVLLSLHIDPFPHSILNCSYHCLLILTHL